jgi:hypothetical protein
LCSQKLGWLWIDLQLKRLSQRTQTFEISFRRIFMKMVRSLLAYSTLALSACGTDPAPPPPPPPPPTDGSMMRDATADGPTSMCFTQTGSAALCPSAAIAQANAMRPSFRLTHIKITAPVALASPILGNIVNGSVHNGGFLWGMTVDTMANTARTGALNAGMITRGTVGLGLLDGTFSYYGDNAPAEMGAPGRWNPVMASTTSMAGRISTGVLSGTVRLPIFDSMGAIITELPLEQASLVNIQLPMDGRCIGLGQVSGGRFNECSSAWATADSAMMPYGTISAVITAEAAQMVRVDMLRTTLCSLISGSDCGVVPRAMWMRQPDAMVGTQPGYRLTAEFSAVSARISN